MRKLAIRLLTLTIYATATVAAPVVSPVNAANNDGKEVKKHHKKPQGGPSLSSRAKPSDNPFPPMNEDPDRRVSGGGY
jgi:hypothetical protein